MAEKEEICFPLFFFSFLSLALLGGQGKKNTAKQLGFRRKTSQICPLGGKTIVLSQIHYTEQRIVLHIFFN
jgi:hypothetical protein